MSALITAETPLKFLAPGGAAVYGRGTWKLPNGDQPGAWMRDLKIIKLCHRGYHWCHAKHAVHWLNAECYLVETRGETIHGDDKSVSQGARLLRRVEAWDDRSARLFAADCAEAVLHLCGDDPRPAAAVDAARRFARGQASAEDLAAASAAASAAARAARVAAGDAAGAARVAAWDAARAARNAAGDAAGAAQTNRLLQYLNGEVS